MNETYNKLKELKKYLGTLNSVVVAFSSGVDSTFLLKVAQEVLGDQVTAVTVQSHLFPKRELEEAQRFCEREGIRHIICPVKELEIEGFRQNPPDRCYLCKKELFKQIQKIAENNRIPYVVEGSNLDDDGDYRPGRRAIAELGIRSPLHEAGLTKQEIRVLSKEMGLPTWEKPSFACLASRFVYGEEITEEKLQMVDKAEGELFRMGFRQFRVRIHGSMARIEVLPEEFDRLMRQENRERIVADFKNYGFNYVTMDLAGYRTGSMNEIL